MLAAGLLLVVAAHALPTERIETGLPQYVDRSIFKDANSSTSVCWKDSYGRGVGKAIHGCEEGLEKSGALCYPLCRDNYVGNGPVCWENCETGYVDEGALCRKDGSIITYAKKSYGRGAGVPLGCAADEVEDAALCYPACKSGYYGVGPVCWESCIASHSVDSGAICCDTAEHCTQKIKDLCAGIPMAIAKAILGGDDVTSIVQAVIAAINAVLGYIMPTCNQLS